MANQGRIWQVDKYGYLINDAKQEHITPQYQVVIDDAVQAYREHIGDDIHSIYVTGSVPRGLAVEGQSDLDIFAILEYYTEPELVMQDWLPEIAKRIADKHECVSSVQMEIWVHGWLLHDPTEFSVSAFILKTHAVCVWGVDMTPDVTAYQFSKRETQLAIANDDVVQIEPDIDEAIEKIEADDSADNVRYWCKRICKNMIHVMFGLVMADESVHTRDMDVSVQYILKHYADQQAQVERTVNYITSPTDSQDEILDFLDDFGEWLIAECDTWLDKYNPDRYLEYQFEYDEDDES